MVLMLDLFSGLGGASEAMVRAGWQVIRCEKEWQFHPRHGAYPVPHTVIGDVKALRPAWLRALGPIDLLWASPPCREFSNAYGAPKPKAAREGVPFEPDLTLFIRAIEIRDRYRPKYWCFENVLGSIEHIEPILGPPTQIIGPFVLWHNLPRISVDYDFEHRKADQDTWSTNPLRTWLKAQVPFELSQAVLESATSPTLEDFQ